MSFWQTVAAVVTGGVFLAILAVVGFYLLAWALYWLGHFESAWRIRRAKQQAGTEGER